MSMQKPEGAIASSAAEQEQRRDRPGPAAAPREVGLAAVGIEQDHAGDAGERVGGAPAGRRARLVGSRFGGSSASRSMIAQPPCEEPISTRRSGSTNAHPPGVVDGDQHVAGALGAHEELAGADQPPDLVVGEAARAVAVDDDRGPALGLQHRRPALDVVLRAVAAGEQQGGREGAGAVGPGHPVEGARAWPRAPPARAAAPSSRCSGRASCRRARAGARPRRRRRRSRSTSCGGQSGSARASAHPATWALSRSISAGVQPGGSVTATQASI